MPLKIETFNNTNGGQSFFKAIGHPLAVEKAQKLLQQMQHCQRLAIYDPVGYLGTFYELYDLRSLKISGIYVQRYEDLGREIAGQKAHLITDLSDCDGLFVASFDSAAKLGHIRHLIPKGCPVYSLDDMRIPDHLLTYPQRYLAPLNFATNFAFFRDEGNLHTRLVTANYWSGYSGRPASLWCCLFDACGKRLADWTQELGKAYSTVTVDSEEIRKRFQLPAFCGQLFVHVVGAAGHDIVKYALDTLSDDGETLSCTHDANAWPADFYAGLPASREDEQVILWVQNSHPCPIPAGSVGLNVMGSPDIAWWTEALPGFGSQALDVSRLLPKVRWPQQLEIQAGKYFVRPRYEILKKASGKRHIAHANVERTDLKPDPQIKKISSHFGKGFILPAPLLPTQKWRTIILPTPMATTQTKLPLALEIYDRHGKKMLRESFGVLSRTDSQSIDVTDLLQKSDISPDNHFGHVELMYDFDAGEEADGWLHGLFRYELRDGSHTAESSFGSHIFNTVTTYKNQPLSYRGTPPGLSTRLFLRLGSKGLDTHCHLIYPASKAWIPLSATSLQLMTAEGENVATKPLQIRCGGSYYWRASEFFSPQELMKAGDGAYIVIRDETCRLFGYHGLIDSSDRFSLDHMFGF